MSLRLVPSDPSGISSHLQNKNDVKINQSGKLFRKHWIVIPITMPCSKYQGFYDIKYAHGLVVICLL